jgi:hypothetical protein
MNTTIRNEVIASIDAMNGVVQESEMEVLCSLVDQMDKASVILESYNGNELEMFAIYQEADGAVQSGDPSGEVDSGAKKDSILMKILMFIPNLLKKIWEFVKQAWNGEIVPAAQAAVDKAEALPDKAKSLFDKIMGKDESWIKEHAAELGIAGGTTLAAVLSFVGFMNRDKLADIVKGWLKSIKSFFSKLSDDIIDTRIIFELTVGNKIKTNVGIKKISEAFKSVPEFIKKTREFNIYKKTGINVSVIETEATALENDVNKFTTTDIILPEPVELDAKEVINELNEFGQVFDSVKNDGTDISGITLSDEAKQKLLEAEKNDALRSKLNSVITKFNGVMKKISEFFVGTYNAVKKLLGKIAGIFKKEDEISAQLKSEYGTSDTEETGEASGDKPSTEDFVSPDEESSESEESEPKNATGETGQTNVGEPSKGMSYTANQVKTFLNNVGKNDVEVPEKPEGKKMIRYKDGDPLTFVYHPDDGQYYYESTEEDVSDDDAVVTESHTGYYFK